MSSRTSGTAVSKKDLKKLAMNVAHGFRDIENKMTSLAICLDALLGVLDKQTDANGTEKISTLLKEELQRRKQMPTIDPSEKAKVENDNPASNVG